MPRRSHRKSRAGCTDCKRRHIKCDEHRPRCVNCQTAGLICAFSAENVSPSHPVTDVPTVTAVSSAVSTPNWGPQDSLRPRPLPVSGDVSGDPPDPNLNMFHLELLHHFTISTCRTFTPEPAHREIWERSAVQLALSFPFLMYEMLAISAGHLAYLRPEQAEWYYTRSTELQTQALKIFNSVQWDVDESNCGALLLFTSLLAIHVLADPSRVVGLNFNQYLDHVVSCLQLLRSVNSLVIEKWVQYLRQESVLKPLFNIESPTEPYDIPEPVRTLTEVVRHTDMTQEAREAYDKAIERLQWMFALSRVPREHHTTVRYLLAWPIQLRENYLDLLNQRRPEALVILAYYAALMTFYRECWAVGDSGLFLIQAISSHLGPHWSQWMAWPCSFLKSPQNVP